MNRSDDRGEVRRVAGLAVALGVAVMGGCASVGDAGWRGENAEPFDGARAACESETAPAPQAERTAKFEACMAGRGWHRP